MDWAVFEEMLACEKVEPGGEIVECEDVFNVAAYLFDCMLAVEQRDHPAFELAEGVTFQFDFSAFGDKV
jgi:hypothetical protein